MMNNIPYVKTFGHNDFFFLHVQCWCWNNYSMWLKMIWCIVQISDAFYVANTKLMLLNLHSAIICNLNTSYIC